MQNRKCQSLVLIVAAFLALAATPAAAQDDTGQDNTVQEDASTKIDKLIESYQKAVKDKSERRKIVTALFQLGEPAFERCETLADEAKQNADALRAESGKSPTMEQVEQLRKLDRAARQATALRGALYMEIVVDAFRQVEKKHKNLNLVFTGQFSHLKKFGKRAVRGALLLMKDIDLHKDQYHNKAWEVLADLGDKSVLKDLKEISTDFLMDDAIQLGAVYAMAALGDLSGIKQKIAECDERIQDDPRNRISYELQKANIYYHGRQYKQAIRIYAHIIATFEQALKERGDEMPEDQRKAYESNIANWAYNCACNLTLDKNLPGAYHMLAMCLKRESDPANYLENIGRDGDLKNLREDKHFKKWFENAKKGEFPKVPPGAKKPEEKASPEGKPGASDPQEKDPGEAAPGQPEKKETPPAKKAPPADPEPDKAVSAADLEAADRLIDDYLKAEGKARAPIAESLVKLGPAAFVRVEARLQADEKARALKKLHRTLCAELTLARFRAVEKLDPDSPLTFSGQFESLKKHGKRAVIGALAVLKNDDANDQHRRWAGDALSDLGDKSVLPELREMADDFLLDDWVQEIACFTMAALGDDSILKQKIQALKEEMREKPANVLKIARMYYRGRQHQKALDIYATVTEAMEKNLAQYGAELEDKEREGAEYQLAFIYYSMACNHGLLGQIDASFKALQKCAEHDRDRQFVRSVPRDGDLRALRKDKRYKQWYEELLERKATGKEKKSPEPEKEEDPTHKKTSSTGEAVGSR
jgi:hypothetical protein